MQVAVKLTAFLFSQSAILRAFGEFLKAQLIVFTEAHLEHIACGLGIQRLWL